MSMSLNTPPTEPTEVVDKLAKFGGANNKWRIKEGDKQMIVALWASGLTPSEVQERAKEEFNIEVSKSQVFKYSKAEKWQKLINKIRNESMADIASVAGSHKKVRLSRAEKIYEKSMDKKKYKEALAATEHQRKEMEGGGDFNLTMNQFNVLNDDELEAKKLEVMERIALMSKHKGVVDVIPTNKTETTGT